MRIACLQFDPLLKDRAHNRARAEELLESAIGPGEVDLVLLPEMAFTGYCFKDRDEIEPFCERAGTGLTSSWCIEMTRRFGTAVVAGFPERADDGRLFNSLVAVDREGVVRHVARKHFLYFTDETWASEGDDFTHAPLPGVGRCAFGICMDLNPKQFKAPLDRFEFASALFDPRLEHRESPAEGKHRLKADVILLANNWLRNPADAALGEEEHARYLVNYWATRLTPALGQPLLVAIANRVGRERGVQFAGCSCVIDLQSKTLLDALDGTEEGVLVVETASKSPS